MRYLDWLADTTGFVPRKECGSWTPELAWLHVGSDVLIWLAYTAIPLTILFFVRRRGVPFSGLIWLFAAFILACGTTHLIDAIIFEHALYRLAGVVKLVTAIVSWATVVSLIPAAPRVMAALDAIQGVGAAADPNPVYESVGDRTRQFIVAGLGAALALLVRQALSPLAGEAYPFILPLLGVVAGAWYGGLWPGLFALAISVVGVNVLFLYGRIDVPAVPVHLGNGLFVFVGVACALLGEAQRSARRAAERTFVAVLMKQSELEAEVARREKAEAELRDRAAALAEAERRTAETLAELDTFIAHAPLGLALLDTDLRFVRINRALADGNRLPVEAHLGRVAPDLFPDGPDEAFADVRRVLATGVPVTDRLVTRHPGLPPDEQTVWRSSYYPVRDPDGTVFGLGVVSRDITEELRADRALRASEARHRELAEELKEADRRKDEFLSVLAHELRNPLAPIRNALEILRLAENNPVQTKKAREVLVRQVAQMVRLIDDLLDVSRITRGKLRLAVERLDLRDVIEAALEISRPQFEKAGVNLTLDVPPDPLPVDGDRVRLAQVVSNVLNNAAKYTDRGGTAALTVAHEGSRLRVRVRDTGVGIPPEVLPRLFELFTQVDRHLNRAQGGLGIGLALVKSLTEMHGGTVTVRSDGVGAGAEFTIDLPVGTPAAESGSP